MAKSQRIADNSAMIASTGMVALPVAPGQPRVDETTNWTLTTGGNFNTAGNWSNGVPASGVDATIDENSNDQIVVSISSADDTANSLTTAFTGITLTNSTLTLQGGNSEGSNFSAGTGTALGLSGGLVDFQNGPSENDTSTISSSGAAVIQTSGIIEVDAGTLSISGNSVFDGTLTGLGDKTDTGAVILEGGATYSFGTAAVVSVAQLTLTQSGTDIILDGNLTLGGGLAEVNGATMTLGGHTLTLADTATAADTLDGFTTQGILLNDDQTDINGATIDSGTTLRNDGVLLINAGGGTALTMTTDGTTTPLLQNLSGKTIEVENGSYSIAGGSISNSGTILLATVGNTIASLTSNALLTSSSVISIGAGDTFVQENSSTISGTLQGASAGAGTFTITGGGTDTIEAATKISVGAFILNVFNDNVTLNIDTTSITSTLLSLEQGGQVNFNTSLSYAGTFAASANASTLFLNLGSNTVSLSGPVSISPYNFGAVDLTGTGTLALSGTTSLSELILSDGVTFSNAGSLDDLGSLQVGDSSGPATIVNAAKGVWDFLSGTIGSSGSNVGSGFSNAGLFENTGSSGIAIVDTAFTNSGTISASAGYETDFYGGIANSGAVAGGGTIGLRGAATYTLATGSSLSVAQLNLQDSATLSLATNLTYAGIFYDFGASGFSAVVNLGADTFTLSGTDYFGDTAIDGTGTLALSGNGTVSSVSNGTGLDVGGGATLVNSGTITQDGYVQLGDSSGLSSGATNTATGTWTLANGYGINRGSDAGVNFLNQGLFRNTEQGTAPGIVPNFTNTGTVSIVAGAEIEFENNFGNSGVIAGAGTLGLSGAGTFSSGETISVANINLNNDATLLLTANLSYAGTFVEQGSYGITVDLGGETLTLTGASFIGNDYNGTLATIDGGGVLDNGGTLTVTNAGYGLDLGGTSGFLNSGLVQQNGLVVIGDSSGNADTITNSGTWDLDTGNGLSTGNNAASSFINTGLFQNASSGETQAVQSVFDSTGTVAIGTADETDFYGVTTLGGTLSGAGTLGIMNGSDTSISASAVVSVARINFYGTATLILKESLTYAGVFADQGSYGNTLNLNGDSLKLTGTSFFGNAYNGTLALVSGGGSLVNDGTMTITDTGFGIEVGGTSTLLNSATVVQDGALQIGDSNGNSTTVTNAYVWDNATGAGIGTGFNNSSTFKNTGKYAATFTGGTQTISAVFSNSGIILSGTGDIIAFSNALNNTGSIEGATGAIAVTAGTTTLSAGTTLTVGTVYLDNTATLALATSVTYAGNFVDQGTNGTTLNLGKNKLTLSGTASFGNNYNGVLAYVGGSGTLALTGTTTITDTGYGVDFGGSTAVTNTGLVTQNGAVQIGDTSGGIATVTNSATGTWNITTANGISLGTNASSSFTNAGLLQNTGTGNTATIATVFSNTGVIDVVNATGGIALGDGGSLAGTLEGSGTISFTGGLFSIAGTTAIKVGNLAIENAGTNVQISASDSFTGGLALGNGATLTLAGTGTVLTVSGTDTLASLVAGTGTLVAAAGSAVTTDGLTLGGSAVLQDAGLMALASGFTIGNSSASSASLSILAGGVYELTGDATIGTDGTGGISNAGTFEMVQGTGTATINPLVTNTGKIFSNSGTLAFTSAVTNDGTMTAENGNGVTFATSVSTSGTATGVVDVSSGGFVSFGGFVGTSETLGFTDSSSSVANLLDASGFDGTISGFGGENVLHLFDFENAKDSFANNVLSVTGTNTNNNVVTASLHFTSGYALSDFVLAGDGGTGTTISFK